MLDRRARGPAHRGGPGHLPPGAVHEHEGDVCSAPAGSWPRRSSPRGDHRPRTTVFTLARLIIHFATRLTEDLDTFIGSQMVPPVRSSRHRILELPTSPTSRARGLAIENEELRDPPTRCAPRSCPQRASSCSRARCQCLGSCPGLLRARDRPGRFPSGLPTWLAWCCVGCRGCRVLFVRFVTEGAGTPDWLRRARGGGGLYRFVRNPMYVAAALDDRRAGTALPSAGVGVWLVVFLVAVVAFVKGYEEPRLAEQFGGSYERYRRAVPGWWPRLTPYRG